MEQLSIGEFARRSRLSLKALRLSDEMGWLLPARVDAGSGYRYYEVGQLERARLVAALRQLEVPFLAGFVVDHLRGRTSTVWEVDTREIPGAACCA
jgi:hypothetical protein